MHPLSLCPCFSSARPRSCARSRSFARLLVCSFARALAVDRGGRRRARVCQRRQPQAKTLPTRPAASPSSLRPPRKLSRGAPPLEHGRGGGGGGGGRDAAGEGGGGQGARDPAADVRARASWALGDRAGEEAGCGVVGC
eukprot:3550018-Rhodomonas_salina.1